MTFHLHLLTWRSLLEDRTTSNLLSQLEPDKRERKNELTKKQNPLLHRKKFYSSTVILCLQELATVKRNKLMYTLENSTVFAVSSMCFVSGFVGSKI